VSLRWKLALAMVVVSTLATAAFGLASYRSTEQRLMAEVDRSLIDLEPVMIQRTAGGTVLASDDGLERFRAQVVALDGNVLQSTFPEPLPVAGYAATFDVPVQTPRAGLDVVVQGGAARRTSSSFSTVETSAGEYRVRTTHFPNGAIMVGRPLDETHRVLDGVRRRTILLLALVAAVAAAIGVLLADRITAPLRRLTAAADHVAESGRPQRGVALVTDADRGETGGARRDEVRRLSTGFGRMLRALARSQEEQERLVQDAGHELRTPLTSLRTNLDTLARYPDITPAQRTAIVDDLQAEVAELSELVDEIVAVAGGGLTGEAANEHPSEFDLTELVGAVAERYTRRSGREVSVTGPPLAVVAERTGVQRAVSCLVDNARKFDPSGAPIEVSVARTGELAGVRVRDHGPGIAEGELDLVFDRFHRAPEARTLPGSGLGLAIVRAVAERHGGTAEAANHPEGGAVVGFTLALADR
jgi:two-component system sensor histidine kinase MprB